MLEGAGLLDSDVPTRRLDDYLDVKGLGSEWYKRREVSATKIQVFFLMVLRRSRLKITAEDTWKVFPGFGSGESS